MRFTPSVTAKLDDGASERVRRNHDQQIGELQALPAASLRVISGVVLPDATQVMIAHGLGRRPKMVKVSPPIDPIGGTSNGVIFEYRGTGDRGPIDASQFIVLAAFAYTHTITVDVEVL